MGGFTGIFQGLSQLGTSISTDIAVASGPQLIPGTSAVYLPSSTGGSIVSTSLAGGSSMILILLIAAVVLFVALKK